VHSCWLAFVFVLHVNSWFTLWAYRAETSWTVGELLLVLAVPMLLYLASHVSVPEIAASPPDRYDMEAHYYAHHRALLGLLAASMFVNLTSEYLLLEKDPVTRLNALRVAGLAILSLGAVSPRRRVHEAITLLALALLLYSFGFVNAPIAH
jgi:hypothetical protein